MRFLHSGHIGDIIAFLPLMRALGGGHLVITDHNTASNLMMQGFKYDSLKPLLEIQPYIESVSYEKIPENIRYDARGFRRYWGKYPIIEMQAKELGIEVPSLVRWLDVEPDDRSAGRFVCCRSLRYRNDSFPWKKIVEDYRERILFVGLYDEYGDFVKRFGPVERVTVGNLLEVARLIEGSSLFVGNQSSPFWIAAGLNHPAIQETHTEIRDSMVPYKPTLYSTDGDYSLIEKFIKTIDAKRLSS